MYVEDILLACNDDDMLHETKNVLSSNRAFGEASYILSIEIRGDRFKGAFGISQKEYFE
jgi:hypothetical protein